MSKEIIGIVVICIGFSMILGSLWYVGLLLILIGGILFYYFNKQYWENFQKEKNLLYFSKLKHQIKKQEEDDYCDGCKYLNYAPLNGLYYCSLNKTPKPHPDELEHLYCENREEPE